jgi:hypothetical protein
MNLGELRKFYILFYSKSVSKWSIFSPKNFKHCSVIACDGDDDWIVINPSHYKLEMIIKKSKGKSIANLIKSHHKLGLTHVVGLQVIKPHRERKIYAPLEVPFACHTAVKYVTGLDVGWCFNPWHLFVKLNRFKNKRNFSIEYQWSVKDG